MRIKLQIVIDNEPGNTTTEDIIELEKPSSSDQPIGLSLAESKQILQQLQTHIVSSQAHHYTQSNRSCCPNCQKKRRIKDTYPVQYRTLFGIITLPSKRLYHRRCQPTTTKTFSPLKNWLKDHNSQELLYIEAKWASLMSFELTAELLKDVLPVVETTNAATVRNHLHHIARRLEQALKKIEPASRLSLRLGAVTQTG